ncbi:hypothetical protein tloyanaT_03550 [Thalassotalea loyana]|uniref:Site-specific integrase n=1 Tax=Thalassotalea loyana TaxID=280483 RepID=A0ABQ6H7I7_9GAMM|nr:hypothetical protein [Thalassotalea loyana]GLX84103.1 hypothetical protein tloyanaT_03550 [Thalassotalea loyana]
MAARSTFSQRFGLFSPILEKQIADLVSKSKAPEPKDYYIQTYKTIHQQASCLYGYLEPILGRLNDEDLIKFQHKGFDAFSSIEYWQRFERCGILAKLEGNLSTVNGKFHLSLLGLLKQHFNNEHLVAPHEIVIPSKLCQSYRTTDCSIVYRYPLENISEIKTYMVQYLQQKCEEGGKQDLQSIIKNITGFLFCLDSGFDLPKVKAVLEKKFNVSEILSSKELCDLILSSVSNKQKKDQFKHMLRYLAPEVHGSRTTTLLLDKEEAFEFVDTISEKLRRELDAFLANSTAKKALSRVMRFIRFMHAFKNYLSEEQLELIHENGAAAFTENEAELWLLYLDTLSKEVQEQHNVNDLRSVLNNLLAYVFNRNVNINELLDYMLGYPHESVHGEWQYQSFKYIKDNYPALFEDVKKVHHISLNRTDAFQVQITTVKTVFSQFLIAIESNDECLSEQQKLSLADRGLYGLTESNHDVLKSLRQHIQHKCKTSVLDLSYGKMQQNAIDWLLDKLGIETTLSYPVSQLKRMHHQEKSRANNYYTLEEAVELAFYIEKTFLVKKDLTHFQKLALKLGRIFLKTAWNMTPVFELTIDDIFYFDSPIGGKKTPAIRLFKRRANYSTQWHKFGLKAEDIEKEGIETGDIVRPVIQDLIEIRDDDSKPFRSALNDDHPFKNRIFLYQSYKYDTPKALDASILTTLDDLLEAQGCQVSYTVQRIRKGGLNYIYRKVLSNFKKYKEAGQHSFEVFLQHYLKDDTAKSTATLTKATKVMGDYFHGRELTDDIIILTDTPEDSRQTPNGSCVSGHDSDAAKVYDAENYKLHKENDSKTTLCADFNACLFCPYYRLVADAEHIWRLLSYKAVVIDSMKASTAGFEFAEQQKENIEILSNRVDEILEKVAEISPAAPADGKRLFKEFGIHEDWELMAG